MDGYTNNNSRCRSKYSTAEEIFNKRLLSRSNMAESVEVDDVSELGKEDVDKDSE